MTDVDEQSHPPPSACPTPRESEMDETEDEDENGVKDNRMSADCDPDHDLDGDNSVNDGNDPDQPSDYGLVVPRTGLTITDEDIEWARKVRGALNAREWRLEDERKPPADAPIRRGRVGLLAHPLTAANNIGKSKSVLGFLCVMYDVVDGRALLLFHPIYTSSHKYNIILVAQQQLVNRARIMYKSTGPQATCCYWTPNQTIHGVLLDFDDLDGPNLEGEEEGAKMTTGLVSGLAGLLAGAMGSIGNLDTKGKEKAKA